MLVRISKKGSLNATKNRHRVASLLANLQLTEKEKDLIFKHFGHSKDVNEEIYQASAGTRQINSTGQMLLEVSFTYSRYTRFRCYIQPRAYYGMSKNYRKFSAPITERY